MAINVKVSGSANQRVSSSTIFIGATNIQDEANAAFDKALELDPKNIQVWNNKSTAFNSLKNYAESSTKSTELLIKIRKEIRQNRQFKIADEIRNKLFEMGIVLEDTPQGAIWKWKK